MLEEMNLLLIPGLVNLRLQELIFYDKLKTHTLSPEGNLIV